MEVIKDEEEFDNKTYRRAKGYGVAWYVLGWSHPTSRTYVVATMVGDNSKHRLRYDDLEPIHDGEFCNGCGQIGCSH